VKNRPFRQRLGFAAAGIRSAWLRERSFRMQCLLGAAAMFALIGLRPPAVWWALVAVIAVMVLALEMINSAIESVVDLLHPGIHPEIKIIKDMIAGAVLIVSIGALVVAGALMKASL
jgi:diacylglycerol kinase (ATP)